MNKSFKITYIKECNLKFLIHFGVNKKSVEKDFISNSYGDIQFVSCERAEYIIQTITVNIPNQVELNVKIEFTQKGVEIIEAYAVGQSWLEYIYLNGYQDQIFRHYKIESQLLEIQDQFLLESVIEQRTIIQLSKQAA